MNVVERQARQLIAAVRENLAQTDTETKAVQGTVAVVINGQQHEYDYTADVTLNVTSWQEPRPYGSDVAYEPMGNATPDNVTIISISPIDEGPITPEVENAIQQDALNSAE